jgi:hypothetical protein
MNDDGMLKVSKSEMTPMQLKEYAIEKHARGQCLSLDETAAAIWEPESQAKPMSAMGILKIERGAMLKIKLAFAKAGIKCPADIFMKNDRMDAEPGRN